MQPGSPPSFVPHVDDAKDWKFQEEPGADAVLDMSDFVQYGLSLGAPQECQGSDEIELRQDVEILYLAGDVLVRM